MTYAEIDQSGKIEQFNMDTVVALSNNRKISVLMPKKVKQSLFLKYKKRLPGLKYKLFSIALFECIKDVIDSETKIIVCNEYEGHDLLLKAQIRGLLDIEGLTIRKRAISFSPVGKKSPAHSLALSVLRRDKPADKILDETSIERMLRI